MNKLVARLKELRSQQLTELRCKAEGKQISEGAERQNQQLWQNIIKDAVEEQPYAQWLEKGKWEHTQLPQSQIVERLATNAAKRAEENDKEADKERR